LGFFKKRAGNGTRRASRLWKQRFKKFGIAALGVVVLVCAVAGLWRSGSFARAAQAASSGVMASTSNAGFRVSEIVVTGRVHVSQEDILSRLGIHEGSPLFAVDLNAAQKNLAGLSWIKSVTVSRRLPGRIAVNVTERTPAALWQYQKKISVVDDSGAVLAADNIDAYKGLPLVVGADAGKYAGALITMLKAEPSVAEMVSSAARVGSRRWDLHLKNGVVVMLPEKDAELALSRLARVEEKNHIFGKSITTVDLRLPDRMVVDANVVKDQKPVKKENI